jgi:hypothetical protein
MGHQYIYREDLGGLCSTCSTYGYEIFEDIINLIKEKMNNANLQVNQNYYENFDIYCTYMLILNNEFVGYFFSTLLFFKTLFKERI